MHISVISALESVGLGLVFNVCVPKQRGLVWDTAALCAAADKLVHDTSEGGDY